MILDTSAVIALLRQEQGHERLEAAIEAANLLAVGTPTLTETAMVAVGLYGARGRSLLARFLEAEDVLIVPFDARHWSMAADAFVRYGKGRHPARLNFGDCMTYATAKLAEAPLLFTGEDFARTDLEVA